MTSNDLFDLYFSFLLIRHDIFYELNDLILEKISETVHIESESENNIRLAISKINGIDKEKWEFAFHSNVYTYRRLLKNNDVKNTILKFCDHLKSLIVNKKYEQAYDFVDSIHFVPILIEKNMFISSRKIRKLTQKYRKKWKVKSSTCF